MVIRLTRHFKRTRPDFVKIKGPESQGDGDWDPENGSTILSTERAKGGGVLWLRQAAVGFCKGLYVFLYSERKRRVVRGETGGKKKPSQKVLLKVSRRSPRVFTVVALGNFTRLIIVTNTPS